MQSGMILIIITGCEISVLLIYHQAGAGVRAHELMMQMTTVSMIYGTQLRLRLQQIIAAQHLLYGMIAVMEHRFIFQ